MGSGASAELVPQLQAASADEISAAVISGLNGLPAETQQKVRAALAAEVASVTPCAKKNDEEEEEEVDADADFAAACKELEEAARQDELVYTPEEEEAIASHKFKEAASIWNSLKDRDTVILKGTWLADTAVAGNPLGKRQDLDESVFLVPPQNAEHTDKIMNDIFSLSYCWMTAAHPDPDGDQFATVAAVMRIYLKEDDVGEPYIFLDWCSMYQFPRSPEQAKAFKRSLKDINVWYAHKWITVLLLTQFPASRVGSTPPYDTRGWPTFERSVASLIKEDTCLFDLGAVDVANFEGDYYDLNEVCSARIFPPSAPEVFAAELGKLRFTNGADRCFVARKYASTMREITGCTTWLEWQNRGWGVPEVTKLCQSLRYFATLKTLVLNRNQLGDAGAISLAKAFETNTVVASLRLAKIGMTDVGAKAMADMLLENSTLTDLYISANGITDDGVSAFVDLLSAGTSLEELHIGGHPLQPKALYSESMQATLRDKWIDTDRDGKRLYDALEHGDGVPF